MPTKTSEKKTDKATKSAKKIIKQTVGSILSVPSAATKTKPGNELQETLKQFIADSLSNMMGTFESLSPTKQWDLIVQLLPYATPKMASTDINASMDVDPLATQLGQLANSIAPDDDETASFSDSLSS